MWLLVQCFAYISGDGLFPHFSHETMWPSPQLCAASNSEPSLSQTTKEANETFFKKKLKDGLFQLDWMQLQIKTRLEEKST